MNIIKNILIISTLHSCGITSAGLTASSCTILQASAHYGFIKSKLDNCFDISISKLNNMIVYSNNLSITGLKFFYKNGTSESFIETTEYINKYTVNLENKQITGVNVTSGLGIQSLKFQLYDQFTQTFNYTLEMGMSNGCFSYLNKSFMHSNYFLIDRIRGCIDNKSLSYFPYLSFEYTFSNCLLKTTTTTSTTTSKTTTTTTSTTTSKTTTTTTSTTTTSTTTTSTRTRTVDSYICGSQLNTNNGNFCY